MIKSIYLAKRKPEFTHDQFVIRWRRHGALAMSQSFFGNHIRLYVQAELIQPAPLAGATADYDAVAYLIQPGDKALSQEELAELETMVVDEYETFSGPILPVIMQAEEKVLSKGAPGGVTAFLFFIDPAKAEPVANHYQEVAAQEIAAVDRVVLNVRRDDLTVGDMSSQLPYRAVVEVSAATLARLIAVLDHKDAPWREADLTAVSRECVMWDRIQTR